MHTVASDGDDRVGEVRTTVPPKETDVPEFECYASSYQELIDDPLRNRFAQTQNHFHLRKWLVLERLLRNSGADSTTLNWLDVGCGRGDLLEIAGGNFASASGCDLSPSMLPSKASFRVYEQRSPSHLPFDDESMDLVTAVCVFHHVHGQNRRMLSDEIRRVLRPGGLCCIIEHNPLNPITRSIVKRCPLDADAALLTARDVSDLLQFSGFEQMKKEYFLYLPERLYHKFMPIELFFSRIPLGGQYAVLARAPFAARDRSAGSEKGSSTVSSPR